MINNIYLIHYVIVSLIVIINMFAVVKAQSEVSKAAVNAINIQPQAKNDIRTTSLVANGLLETCAVLTVLFSAGLLFFLRKIENPYVLWGEAGIAMALCLTGMAVSLASINPTSKALLAIARQPFLSKKITNFMMLSLSVLQTSFIFGFIVSAIIFSKLHLIKDLFSGLQFFSSGLCMGLGVVGPLIGLSKFCDSCYEAIAFNRQSYSKVLSLAFISQAMIETPILFSLLTSVILITVNVNLNIVSVSALICIALIMGLGTLGPGVGSGVTASKACDQLAKNPELYSTISRACILTQGFIDACVVYCFGISMLMLLLNS